MQKLQKFNPFTGKLLYEVPVAGAVDLVRVIQAAQMAFQEWRNTNLDERIVFLKKIRNEYLSIKKELIESESLDQGLPYSFTEKANYDMGLQKIDQFVTELEAQKSSTQSIQYFPHGVTAVILSWNLSNRLFVEKVLGAVLAGNSVIVKCSSQASSTGLQWQLILKKISEHSDLIQFVQGEDQSFKDLLVTHPGIKAVNFTGTLANASAVLKKIVAVSHLQFKKIQINSGTKNSTVALKEPNDELGKSILESFLMGSGQLAWNSARFFTLEKYEKMWLEYIQQELSKLRPLESPEENHAWTPMIKKHSIENYQSLHQQALQDHAKLMAASLTHSSNDSLIDKKNFVAPLFTQDMSKCSTLQQDEIQTPIFIFSSAKYPFDIAKMNNVSYYGHSACIWGDNLDGHSKLVQNMEVGQICFNQWGVYLAQSFPAVKQSAFGLLDQRIFGAFNSNVKILS